MSGVCILFMEISVISRVIWSCPPLFNLAPRRLQALYQWVGDMGCWLLSPRNKWNMPRNSPTRTRSNFQVKLSKSCQTLTWTPYIFEDTVGPKIGKPQFRRENNGDKKWRESYLAAGYGERILLRNQQTLWARCKNPFPIWNVQLLKRIWKGCPLASGVRLQLHFYFTHFPILVLFL